MKLYYWGLSMVMSAMLLPGCSQEDLTTDNVAPIAPEFIPGDSEIEIRFMTQEVEGQTSVNKRAAVDGNGTLDSMGVFCLARGKQNVNEIIPDIRWFENDDRYSYCLMKNVKARKEGSDLTWDGHYYYPISQFYMYEFYGYYPYTDNVTYEADNERHRAVAHYTIDGTQDLIWGRTTNEDAYAYSAKYFRNSNNAKKQPMINLEHMLTRLKFVVQPGEDIEGSGVAFPDADKVSVKSLSLLDMDSHIDVCIADWENRVPATEVGDLGVEARNHLSVAEGAKSDFVLRETDGTDLKPVPIGDKLGVQTPIGGSIMAVPSGKYRVRIVLHKDDGTELGQNYESEWDLTLVSSETDESDLPIFRNGVIYTVSITVHDPKNVEAQANLQSWVDSEFSPGLDL